MYVCVCVCVCVQGDGMGSTYGNMTYPAKSKSGGVADPVYDNMPKN